MILKVRHYNNPLTLRHELVTLSTVGTIIRMSLTVVGGFFLEIFNRLTPRLPLSWIPASLLAAIIFTWNLEERFGPENT